MSAFLGGDGKMDYVVTARLDLNRINNKGNPILEPIASDKLYVTMTKSGLVAHYNYNFGNFLWGAGAHGLFFIGNNCF
jgi:hypothetical protein